jgi:hypothetical protein
VTCDLLEKFQSVVKKKREILIRKPKRLKNYLTLTVTIFLPYKKVYRRVIARENYFHIVIEMYMLNAQ